MAENPPVNGNVLAYRVGSLERRMDDVERRLESTEQQFNCIDRKLDRLMLTFDAVRWWAVQVGRVLIGAAATIGVTILLHFVFGIG